MLKRAAAGALASCIFLPAMATQVGVAAFNLAWAGILLSSALNARQTTKPTSFKLPVQTQPKQIIATSDHCPRVTKIAL